VIGSSEMYWFFPAAVLEPASQNPEGAESWRTGMKFRI